MELDDAIHSLIVRKKIPRTLMWEHYNGHQESYFAGMACARQVASGKRLEKGDFELFSNLYKLDRALKD
jgi:hypothetical protein